ncbi:MAG: MFS transporter [Oscillospiraceae bacterium]|nr:MFS transporter [Oscillospiraceae bacterium]
MKSSFKRYVIFWLSQSLSQLGSAMTGFGLILWAYSRSGSAMAVSLMSFFHYLPYIIVSLFAGGFVDRHSKKKIMLVSDTVAAFCSAFVLIMSFFGLLRVWQIYMVNFVIGFTNAFQGPASNVAAGKVVPDEKLEQMSGMNSFSGSMVTILSPIFAASLYSLGGLGVILAIDLVSFVFAFLILLFVLRIPDDKGTEGRKKHALAGCAEGFGYLRANRAMLLIVLTMALLNFFSRLTYENILSPMILSRSQNDIAALGIVNAAMGIGGIIGGMIVSSGKIKGSARTMIYISAMLSFLLGDILMAVGRNSVIWAMAGFAASFPIAFINAGQMSAFYRRVPKEIQGRVFAVRNAVQFGAIPIAILLGGLLADKVFEPFMRADSAVSDALGRIVGRGAGSGMAVMFLITGTLGALFSLFAYHQKDIRDI